MDNYINRLNSFGCTSLLVFFLLGVANYLTIYTVDEATDGRPANARFAKVSQDPNSKEDQAILEFDVQANLDAAFHWNTKLLYLYLVAYQPTASGNLNEVTIWDRIITDKADSVFAEPKIRSKYWLRSSNAPLWGSPITLTLKYRYVPQIGLMHERVMGSTIANAVQQIHVASP